MKMAKVTIKRGTVELKCDRTDLIEVLETADGIAFTLKGNIQYYFTQQFMQDPTKKMIKQATDNFPGKSLIINLDNPRSPVLVDAV
jgi:hypothetical protein